MSRWERRWVGLAGVVVVMGFALAGCENDVDSSENVLTPNEGVEDGGEEGSSGEDGAGEGAADAAGACEVCPEAEEWYVAKDIRVVSIDNNPEHLAVGSLNAEWSKDIARGELTLFFRVADRQEGKVGFEVVNGARSDVDNGVCIMADRTTPIHTDLSGCTVESTGKVDVFIYGGSPNHPKICAPQLVSPNAIYIQDVKFTADITGECGAMKADVDGVIALDILEQTCSCLFRNKPEQLSDTCGTADPAGTAGITCAGCGIDMPKGLVPFGNLSESLKLLAAGQPFGTCQTSDAKPAVCLEAAIDLELTPPPAVCPQ